MTEDDGECRIRVATVSTQPDGQPSRPLQTRRISGRLPRLPHQLVLRPRLMDRLDVRAPLTILRAPVGFGKTTLLTQWLLQRHSPHEVAAWITVHRESGHSAAFWMAVLGALVDAGLSTQNSDPAVSPRTLAEQTLATAAEPVTLVVDDYDRMVDASVERDLLDIVRHSSGLRLIVATRGYRRFHRHGHIDLDSVELTADDLRLTTTETAQLLTAIVGETQTANAHVIREQTGGWPELTRAVGLSLRGSSFADLPTTVSAVGGSYLRHRILPEIRGNERIDFMLATSLPETFTPEMATAFGDDASVNSHMTWLETTGLLHVDASGHIPHYRWPGAARRVLAAELARRAPESVPVRHARLATWYLRHDDPGSALRHAMAAEDWTLAIEVIDRNWRQLFVANREEMHAALRHAPLDIVATSVRALAVRDMRLQAPDDRVLEVPALPTDKGQLAELGRSNRAYDIIDSGIAVISAFRRRGLFRRAVTYCDRLCDVAAAARITRTPEIIPVWPALQLQFGVTTMLGDDLHRCKEFLLRAYESADDSPHAYIRADAASKLALASALIGDAAAASAWLRKRATAPTPDAGMSNYVQITDSVARMLIGVEHLDLGSATAARKLIPDLEQPDEFRAIATVAEARLAVYAGAALDMLARLGNACRALRHQLVDGSTAGPLLAAAEADLLTALGHGNEAAAVLRRMSDHPVLRVRQARLTLLSGQPHLALRLINDAAWARGATPRARLDGLLIQAVAAHRTGNLDAALGALRHAIHTAKATGAIRAFATAPKEDLAELACHLPQLKEILDHPALQRVGEVFPRTITVVQLTKREQMVLDRLDEDLTLPEIAEALFVSPNTVKTQLRSIYRKLGVDSRKAAAIRAREWALVSRSN